MISWLHIYIWASWAQNWRINAYDQTFFQSSKSWRLIFDDHNGDEGKLSHGYRLNSNDFSRGHGYQKKQNKQSSSGHGCILGDVSQIIVTFFIINRQLIVLRKDTYFQTW